MKIKTNENFIAKTNSLGNVTCWISEKQINIESGLWVTNKCYAVALSAINAKNVAPEILVAPMPEDKARCVVWIDGIIGEEESPITKMTQFRGDNLMYRTNLCKRLNKGYASIWTNNDQSLFVALNEQYAELATGYDVYASDNTTPVLIVKGGDKVENRIVVGIIAPMRMDTDLNSILVLGHAMHKKQKMVQS